MCRCLAAFLDFCYIARRNAIDEPAIQQLESSLARFHQYRQIFVDTGVRVDPISLPRQHSLTHYPRSIHLFGSPNGLCSSITESKHIKAVKEPWRRSSRFNALIQMLRTNCGLDKLTAAKSSFTQRGMMVGSTSSYTAMILEGGHPEPLTDNEDGEDENGAVDGPPVMSSVKLACKPRKYPSRLNCQPRLIIRRAKVPQRSASACIIHPTAATPHPHPPLSV